MGQTFFVYIALLGLRVALAANVPQSQDAPSLEYDFIVVGGGTAGNVVANRLSENLSVSVLVLEAGGTDEGNLNISIPFFCTRATPGTSIDWNYTTVPQLNLNGRTLAYPRGFVLGGSSSISELYGIHSWKRDDYDRYATLSGDPGWGWDQIIPYFRKNEMLTAPADHHNTTGQFDPSVHSTQGIINSVSLYGFQEPIDSRVISLTTQLPEFPFNVDYNSGSPTGVGYTQYTIRDGQRSSSATSYLGPQFRNRKNLHVLLHSRVSRILRSGSIHGQPIMKTVEFQTLGIKTLVHNPSVGKNMSDHLLIGNRWKVNSTDTFEAFTSNTSLTQNLVDKWTVLHDGVLASGTFNNIGWVRFQPNSTVLQSFPDAASGPRTPHIEILLSNGVSRPPFPTSGNFLTVSAVFLTPTSRGTVSINSSNPFDAPTIDLNFLSTQYDTVSMREAVRTVFRFISAPAWADYVVGPAVGNVNTDDEIDAFVRATSVTLFHPIGTAAMSPNNSGYGVVDPDLKVKGVVGLRIIDASVVPIVPAAHTQAVTYVFGERGADLIKAAWHI